MSKRICILTSVHPSFDTRIFHKQAKTLVKKGYEVSLVVQHSKTETIDGIKIIPLPKPQNRFHRMFILTWQAFWKGLNQKVDLYHIHDPELLPVGVLLKIFTGKKIIYDVHENVSKQILSKYWLPLAIRKPISWAYNLVERIGLKFVDKIILAEDSYKKSYSNYKDVETIRNYPVLSFVDNLNNEVYTENDSNKSDLIYVGSITKLRGVFELIEATKLVKEQGQKYIKLNLVGPISSESLLREIKEKIIEYGLQENIALLGPKNITEVYKLLSDSKIGLCILHPDLNYVESLPTKLFEYMSTGLPVIASNFPFWQSIVEGNNCGLTTAPLDVKELGEKIIYLLDRPELRATMGINGKETVFSKYSWEQEGKKLISLYDGIWKNDAN